MPLIQKGHQNRQAILFYTPHTHLPPLPTHPTELSSHHQHTLGGLSSITVANTAVTANTSNTNEAEDTRRDQLSHVSSHMMTGGDGWRQASSKTNYRGDTPLGTSRVRIQDQKLVSFRPKGTIGILTERKKSLHDSANEEGSRRRTKSMGEGAGLYKESGHGRIQPKLTVN